MNSYRPILSDSGAGGEGGGGGGAAQPPALDINTLPEELRKEPSLAAIKDVHALAKGYVNAQKMIGAKRIALPAADAGDQAWNDFYAAIGRPEAPDKYEMPKVEVHESLKPDEKKMTEVKGLFHKLGLTPKQASGIMEYYMKSSDAVVRGQLSQTEQQSQAATAELKQEWGDKFDANLDVAKAVIKKFGDEKFLTYLEGSGMGNNAQLIRVLNKVGMAMMEDVSRGGGAGGDLNLTDQSRAVAEIDRLKGESEFQKALHDVRNPGHNAAVQRWTNLFAAAYPGKSE